MKTVSKNAISVKEIAKHSANAKNKGVDWRDNNPNSEKYIRNKPTNYLEIDKKLKNLNKNPIDNYIDDIKLNGNNLEFTLKNGKTFSIDMSKYIDNKNVVSGSLDNTNKKISLKLTDNSTVDIDISDIFNSIENNYNNTIKQGSLDNNNEKISLTKNDNSNIDIDLTELYNTITNKVLDSGNLDNANKKISLKLKDNSIINVDLTQLYTTLLDNKNVKQGTLDKSNKKIILTLTDNSVIDIDVSDIFNDIETNTNNIIKEGSLDNANKKITLTKNNNSVIEIDLTDLYNSLSGIPKPSSANENNIAIFDNDKNIKDSNITISEDGATLSLKDSSVIKGEGIEININGNSDRYSYIDFHSDDTNVDYSARLIRYEGVNGNMSILNKGAGNITTDFENGKILQLGGFSQILNRSDDHLAGWRNNQFTSIDDLDNLIYTGIYNGDMNNIKNSPIVGWCFVTVKRHSNKNNVWVVQEIEGMSTSGDNTGVRYIRVKRDSNGWENWTPITLNKEIPIQYLSDLVSYENGWEDYNSDWRPTIVKKSNGMVYINGLIKGGNNGTRVCVLPAEFKPNGGSNHRVFICMTKGGKYQRVDINKYGSLIVQSDGTREGTDWVSLQIVYQATTII